jgi:cytochrome c oxidase cbb3-type subunit 3
MSDFTGPFWAYFVAIVTLAGMLACGLLLWSMSTRRVPGAKAETTGHVWDEDLGEYNHPLPRWWMWMFYLSILFSLGYLVLYPGLGIYDGALQWSSVGEHDADVKQAEERYGPLYAKYASLDLKKVAADPEALAMGQRLFLNNCAQCHAADGGGSRGFPSLADRDWLYGGEPELIKASILNGRNGVMPSFGAVLGAEGAKDVAHFIMALAGRPADSIRVSRGKEKFAANCVGCHGSEGKGNILMGAPNLTDEFWLHGASESFLIETITKGRKSVMPAHNKLLGEAKVHLLAAYVYGLSNAR